jgi:hypothetical protein
MCYKLAFAVFARQSAFMKENYTFSSSSRGFRVHVVSSRKSKLIPDSILASFLLKKAASHLGITEGVINAEECPIDASSPAASTRAGAPVCLSIDKKLRLACK